MSLGIGFFGMMSFFLRHLSVFTVLGPGNTSVDQLSGFNVLMTIQIPLQQKALECTGHWEEAPIDKGRFMVVTKGPYGGDQGSVW